MLILFYILFWCSSNDDDENTVVTMTTTTATSEDEWVGLQQTRQPVDQSETVSGTDEFYYFYNNTELLNCCKNMHQEK